jgi:glycosyltransferase involved in cell wall biosynthesis
VARLLREECDLLVIASTFETFGVVVIEALASGKPVVSTRCGGPEDVLGDPALGALCPREDAGALAGAILDVARRLPSLDGARIRESAVQRFDLRVIARDLEAVYQEIAADRAGDGLR